MVEGGGPFSQAPLIYVKHCYCGICLLTMNISCFTLYILFISH